MKRCFVLLTFLAYAAFAAGEEIDRSLFNMASPVAMPKAVLRKQADDTNFYKNLQGSWCYKAADGLGDWTWDATNKLWLRPAPQPIVSQVQIYEFLPAARPLTREASCVGGS